MSDVSTPFNYTGASVIWTVPNNVLQITIQCWGASGGQTAAAGATNDGWDTDWQVADTPASAPGGNNLSNASNAPGYASGTLTVTPGQQFTLTVGGNGKTVNDFEPANGSHAGGTGGFNGGGNGGAGYAAASGAYHGYGAAPGAGGGGGTDVRSGGVALSNRIVAAGGSGGEGGNCNGIGFDAGSTAYKVWTANPTTPNPPYGTATSPGNGIYATFYASGGWAKGGYGGNGGNGGGGTGNSEALASPSSGGNGGVLTADGAGGHAVSGGGTAGSPGIPGTGGAGGSCNSTGATTDGFLSGGGGGGGGMFSGGGGGTGGFGGPGAGGGGGGGSNYVDASLSNPVSEPHAWPPISLGANGIGGLIVLSYVQPPDAPAINDPANFASFPVTAPLVVDFTFSSPDPAAVYASYDIEWQDAGSPGYTLTHGTGNPSFTFAANFFTTGHTYNIQVRTYDTNGDVSPWSEITVTGVTPPTIPVISAPTAGQTESSGTFSVTWTNPSGSPEVMYQITFLSAGGGTIFDTGPVNAHSRINFCPNPSFEVDTSSWVITGGAVALSTTFKVIGSDSGKVTWGASSVAQIYIPVATQPGYEYEATVQVAAGTVATDPFVQLVAQNPTDTSPFASGDTVTNWGATAGVFQILTLSFIAQSSTTWIMLIPNGGTVTSGQVTYIDTCLVEINATGTPLTYFDGTNANGNTGTVAWTGTTGKSISKITTTDVLTYSMNWGSLGSQSNVTAKVKYSNVAGLGIWSPIASVLFNVNVNPPGVPTVTLTQDNNAGTVTLAITAVNTPNATTYLDVFRTDVTNGTPEIRLATQVIPDPTLHTATFVDYTAATRTIYTYRVRAYSASAGYADAT